MVRVRRNSKDGTYTTTSDSSEDGFDSDSNNSSSILGDDRSDGHYYDYATFEETFDNVVNEDGFPLISLEMHLRFCFEAVDTMAQALSNTPSITNPVKKKLVKNITSVKDELESMDSSLFALTALCDGFSEDFANFKPRRASFGDLTALIVSSDHEIRTLVNQLVPPSRSPAHLLTELLALKPRFVTQESTHPHLAAQFHSLLSAAEDIDKAYTRFLTLVQHGITMCLHPACIATISRYTRSVKNACCSWHKDTVLPWVLKVSRLGMRLWKMVHHQPRFPGDVLAAKSQMYAMHLERMLNPVMKVRERGLTLTELGVVLVTLVPVTLAMRFVTASQDGLEKAFVPVLNAMRGVEVVYTRTRRWIALKGYLKGKEVARVMVVEARKKTARTKKEESRETSPMAEEMDKAEEKQPIAAKGTENLPTTLNKRRGKIVMEQENMENENKAKSLGEKTNNSEVGQNKKKKKRKNKNKGEKQEN